MNLGMDHRSPQQADQTEQRDKDDGMSDKLSHNLTSLILTHLPSSPSGTTERVCSLSSGIFLCVWRAVSEVGGVPCRGNLRLCLLPVSWTACRENSSRP